MLQLQALIMLLGPVIAIGAILYMTCVLMPHDQRIQMRREKMEEAEFLTAQMKEAERYGCRVTAEKCRARALKIISEVKQSLEREQTSSFQNLFRRNQQRKELSQ